MRRFQIKGGYGEHGRSCFMAGYGSRGRFYMVDCGIMDSDSFPYPRVSSEELAMTDYLFLTHCHKDHSGAFERFVEQGFQGVLVTTQMTLTLSEINYPNTVILPTEFKNRSAEFSMEGITLNYGRSGHCPGGVWFFIRDIQGSVFFSGDYQADTLAYACDPAQRWAAELGVLDCAHSDTELSAESLREQLREKLEELLFAGRRVILPLPRYGRGAELLMLLQKDFPQASVMADSGFAADLETILTEKCWYQEAAYERLTEILTEWKTNNQVIKTDDRKWNESLSEILLIGDTHLQKESNQKLVKTAVERGAAVLVTGRVKPGGLSQKLLEEGKAERLLFPHHQSAGDLKKMISENYFDCVLPFHNERKDILF